MAEILAHIGAGRCGSTSIQTALTESRDILAGLDLTYPVAEGDINQNALLSLVEDKSYRIPEKVMQAVDDMREAARGASRLVLSSEGFLHLGPTRFLELVREIAPQVTRADVIAFVRAPHDHYLSLMQQRLRRYASIIPPERFVRPNVPALGRWKAASGEGSFTLRPFDPARLEGGDVVADFGGWLCRQTGQPVALPSCQLNSSMTAEQAIVLQRLRRTARGVCDGQIHAVSQALVAFFNQLNAQARVGNRLRLSEPALSAIVRANRENMDALDAEFPDLGLAVPDVPDVPEIDLADAPWTEDGGIEHVLERHDAALVAHLAALVPELAPQIGDSIGPAQTAAVDHLLETTAISEQTLITIIARYWRKRDRAPAIRALRRSRKKKAGAGRTPALP